MSERARSLGDRLAETRRRAFVGRAAEIELFVQALEAPIAPFSVLHVHGPGGIGKSTLLARLADEARARGVACTVVDARAIAPTSGDLLRALGADALEALSARIDPLAIFVDTYEELTALDDWIREELLPALPEHAWLVLAGRDPPRTAWRADPGVAAILRVRALQNLTEVESRALLGARGVRGEALARAHTLTHGHPLALALVAALACVPSGERAEAALPSLTPDVVRALLDRILRAIPDRARRDALEIAALSRVVDESLLADLGVPSPDAVFTWMRTLSFVDESDEGVAPHDLVRDAIAADLAMRDPSRERTLRDAIRERAKRILAATTGPARERAAFDALFTVRRDPTLAGFYDWRSGLSGASRPLREDELGPLLAEIAREEGAEAAAIARHWWERQPEAFHALLDRAGAYLGTLVYLRLPALDDEIDRARDPLVARAAEIVREAPLRAGEHVRVARFWIWRGGYQDPGSAAHAPHTMIVVLDWAFSVGLAWCVVVVQRADVWRPFFAQIGMTERPEASFALGTEHRFTVLARDFRALPWTGAGAQPRPAAPGGGVGARVVLSQDEFAAAVREALRLAARPRELASSPLLATRVMAEWSEDETPTPEMLRELLEVAATSADDARDERPRRCVELTYLRPAPTQEIAAERLGLSFSTYRRQLARGVECVVAYLWEREVRGGA